MITQYDVYMRREHPEMLGLVKTRPEDIHVDLLDIYQKPTRRRIFSDTPSPDGLPAYLANQQARMAYKTERRKDFGKAAAAVVKGTWDVAKTTARNFVDTGFQILDREIDRSERAEANDACMRMYGLPTRALVGLTRRIRARNVPHFLEALRGYSQQARNAYLEDMGMYPEQLRDLIASLPRRQRADAIRHYTGQARLNRQNREHDARNRAARNARPAPVAPTFDYSI